MFLSVIATISYFFPGRRYMVSCLSSNLAANRARVNKRSDSLKDYVLCYCAWFKKINRFRLLLILYLFRYRNVSGLAWCPLVRATKSLSALLQIVLAT